MTDVSYDDIKTCDIECKSFMIDGECLPDMKYHVFISKQSTKCLSELIESEFWGKDNILLYKYLDYIWRFQLIDKQIKLYTYNNERRLVFYTGLYGKNNGKPVYLSLIPNKPNKNRKKVQPWRIAFGKSNGENMSFVNREELVYGHGILSNDIPCGPQYFRDYRDEQFHPNYNFLLNMDDNFRSVKDRIVNIIKTDMNIENDNGCLSKLITKDYIHKCIKTTLNFARKNINIIGNQVFIERDIIKNTKLTKGYHLEKILPLTITINNQDIYFTVVLRPNHKKKEYNIMSIISRQMAYSNARLISKVQLPWLVSFANTNILPLQNTQILPALPTQQQTTPISASDSVIDTEFEDLDMDMINIDNNTSNVSNINNINNNVVYNNVMYPHNNNNNINVYNNYNNINNNNNNNNDYETELAMKYFMMGNDLFCKCDKCVSYLLHNHIRNLHHLH
mmetsp:Transcript_49851/g.61216  ORF Transcript_49851/g.61216 Transcript_49851/m.61216 type:complete len:450 (+) Transcript_49851:62-1411(+)